MAKSYYPDFSPEVELEIELEEKKIHEKYWPQLAGLDEIALPESLLRRSIRLIPASTPPVRQPKKLTYILGTYASELFEIEAKRYTDKGYLKLWLVDLGQRIFDAVIDRTSHLENLTYHAREDVMRTAIMESIRQMTNRRLHGISPTSNYNDSRDTQSVRVQKAPLDETKKSRKAIKDAYFSNFPETMIIDVCWAARQHRREWDRWLKGELKDGCKPDRVFRAVMTSDKGPKEYRPEQRPKDWK